jgi:hypothetical protein
MILGISMIKEEYNYPEAYLLKLDYLSILEKQA